MSGPNPLGVSGQRVGPTFLGLLVSGPFSFKALGSDWVARGAGLRPKVPTLFFLDFLSFLKLNSLLTEFDIRNNKNS